MTLEAEVVEYLSHFRGHFDQDVRQAARRIIEMVRNSEEKEPLLVQEPGEDVLYMGPLDKANEYLTRGEMAYFQHETFVPLTGRWRVELCSLSTPHEAPKADALCSGTDDWGIHRDWETAVRYCYGAVFGPIDTEYDEDALRAALKIEN